MLEEGAIDLTGKSGQASLRRCPLSWALRDEYEFAGLRWGMGNPGRCTRKCKAWMDMEYSGNSGDFWQQGRECGESLGCERGEGARIRLGQWAADK